MAAEKDIPPVPPAPSSALTPPVEPPPAAPVAPPAATEPPRVDPNAPPAPYTGAYTPGPPQGLSIASLACGIGGVVFSFFGFGFLPALAAVITGHLAQKRQPHARGYWLTGLITGYVGLGISVLTGIALAIGFAAWIAMMASFGTFS